MSGWGDVERDVASYAAYRSYAHRSRRRWYGDPMDELDLTDRERAVAYLITLGLFGAVLALSVGMIYLTALILSVMFHIWFYEALMMATGLFMILLWPIPFLILLLIVTPLAKRVGRGSAEEAVEGGEAEGGDQQGGVKVVAGPNAAPCSVEER